MENAFGLIYTGDASMQLRELTFSRSVAAVPFGGRYRTIDFMLSDLVNTGIYNVGIIAQKNYHSLMDHLESGKEWDLHRKRDGLFVLPPFVTHDNTGVYKGTVDAIRSCMGYIRRASQKYVILMGSHTIYNTTYNEMIAEHIASGADITIMYNRVGDYDMSEQFDDLRIAFDEDGRVTDLALNPVRPATEFASCDAFVMEKTTLEYLVEDAYAHALNDFTSDVLIKNVKNLNIRGWEFKGYVARINSLGSYYRHNMALLDKDVSKELFSSGHPIYTKIKDEFPASYVGEGQAVNSIVADGCMIEGRVENSVLFRGVHVAPGAVVRNSIIMQGSEIGENSSLDNMILDKNVTVGVERTLSGHGSYPVIIRKGSKV
ncbi:MAG: glucose-1-phosphate adenylyltransferase subunit GlgD [Clostridiales bacterium]|nr:glucose-1-phosphate adenylyltransferase subunit GlgD [Clostridiales bacterium]